MYQCILTPSLPFDTVRRRLYMTGERVLLTLFPPDHFATGQSWHTIYTLATSYGSHIVHDISKIAFDGRGRQFSFRHLHATPTEEGPGSVRWYFVSGHVHCCSSCTSCSFSSSYFPPFSTSPSLTPPGLHVDLILHIELPFIYAGIQLKELSRW